jgi:hypothetical protein
MKRPSLKFNKDAIATFLLNHCEKLVVGVVGLVALGLAWGGLNALRLKAVGKDETPEAVSRLTADTIRHIDAAAKPPADTSRKGGELALTIDPWRPQQVKIAAAPQATILDRPLFQELGKRAKPSVLPLEDLQAVAGVAVFADQTDPNAMMPMGRGPGGFGRPADPGIDAERPAPQRPGRQRRPKRGEEQPVEQPPMPEFNPAMALPRGKVVPYVIVTGLVPVAKQRDEFNRCFATAGLRDPQLDRPRWSQYLVERSLVTAGGAARWERLKLKNIDINGQPGGMAPMQPNQPAEVMQQEGLPPTFLLGTDESDFGYVAGLPQRIDDGWGSDIIHPWFRPQLKKMLDEAAPGMLGDQAAVPIDPKKLLTSPEEFDGQVGLLSGMQLVGEPERGPGLVAFAVKSSDGSVSFSTDPGANGERPVFAMSSNWARTLELDNGPKTDTPCTLRVRVEMLGQTPVAHILGITYAGEDGQSGEEIADPVPFPLSVVAGGGGEFGQGGFALGNWAEGGAGLEGTEFRLFRFVDTTVTPGQKYRYRVRLSVHNPNFGLDRRHLDDASAAKNELLTSTESNETPPVAVPEPMSLLVRTFTKDETKRLKMKQGWVEVIVMAASEQTGNYSLRGLLTEIGGLANVDAALNKPGDARVRGEDAITNLALVDIRGRQEKPTKATGPTEVVEMLFVRPDGSCELVSAADSQSFYDRYQMTLDVGANAPPGGEPPPGSPAGGLNPFEFPPQGPRGQ